MAGTSLALLWHMHQPMYRLAGERVCLQPWVRLHASRAYYDMARVLEEFPAARVTINLVPTLLDQVEAYAGGASDLFREMARLPAEDLDESQRRFLVDHFFSAQETRMIRPLPRYAALLAQRGDARRRVGVENAWREFGIADLRDLQALFDLAWFGFKAVEDHPALAALRRRGRGFGARDIADIHAIQDDILRRIPGLYRDAATRGQVEIAASPYAHPILPLLIDTDSAREAMPGSPMPPRLMAPEDAAAQIGEGLARVEAVVGVRPRGMWPSEGSLSRAAVELMGACGVAWAAGDIDVLRASERDGEADARRPWRLDSAGGVDLLFRDHDLSDRIGFVWADVDPQAAAAELLAEVRSRAGGVDGAIVLIALDGENPWEQYPDAGAGFLRALYAAAAAGDGVAACTVGEAIARCPVRGSLRRLRAGSWINADFGTWIGGPEKNRAWALLGETRALVAPALADPERPEDRRRAAWMALRAAEGSDWFWWLDGQHDSLYHDDFDRLFRAHQRQACEALALPPPEMLHWPIATVGRRAAGVPAAGTMAADPVVDGYESSFFEWYGVPVIDWTVLVPASTMQRAQRPIESLRVGVTAAGDLALRFDPGLKVGPAVLSGVRVDLVLSRPGTAPRQAMVQLDEAGEPVAADPPGVRARARKVLEVVLPASDAGLEPGAAAILLVRLRIASEVLAFKEIEIRRPGPDTAPGGAGA